MTYEIEFDQAMDRTRSWGLPSPVGSRTTSRYVSPDTLAKVGGYAQDLLGAMQPEEVSAQCFAISAIARVPLEEVLGLPLTYTLGYVNLGRGVVFHTPVDDLKSMMGRPRTTPHAVELHAWLTLPSREIIDLTLATTLGIVRKEPDLLGRVAFIHPSDLVGNQSYHPQVLGEEFLRRTGALVEFSGFVVEPNVTQESEAGPPRGGRFSRTVRSLFRR